MCVLRKKKFRHHSMVLLLIAGLFLFSSCAPKIYGQTKRKKRGRKCGCELILPEKKIDRYTLYA